MKSGTRRARAAHAIIGEAPGIKASVSEPQKIYSQQNGTAKPSDAPQNTITILQKHIADLTQQLQEVKNQKEDLERDVENLCMQQTSSVFDSSLIFSERAISAEKQLRLVNAQLSAMTEERDGLKEDLRGHRDSKRSVESSFRAERERATKMENDLKFYQEQSARAISDRDQARWEVEELRRIEAELEERATSAESAAENAQSELSDMELRLTEAKSTIAVLDKKARESEAIPGLKKKIKEDALHIEVQDAELQNLKDKLHASGQRCKELEADLDLVSKKAAELDSSLDEFRGKAAASANTAAETIQKLQVRVIEVEETNSALESRVEDAEGNLAASQAEAETAATEANSRVDEQNAALMERQNTMESSYTMKVAELETELETLRHQLQEMTDRCEQATSEKVQTLLRVSQAEQTAEQAFEETGLLLDQLNDLKAKEAQARQEKVAALMQVAELEAQQRGGDGSAPINKGYNWRGRLWGAATTGTKDKDASQTSQATSPETKLPSETTTPSDANTTSPGSSD